MSYDDEFNMSTVGTVLEFNVSIILTTLLTSETYNDSCPYDAIAFLM